MAFNDFKTRSRELAQQHIAGIPAPTHKEPPSAEESKAAQAAWEAKYNAALALEGATEESAEAAAGPKPDPGNDATWTTVTDKHPTMSAFADGDLWKDPNTTLYIIAETTAQLIDESKYKDDSIKAKVNELINAVNTLLTLVMPPLVPPGTPGTTTVISKPLSKL